MAAQQSPDSLREPETFSISLWRFRLLAVNPGRKTYQLIAILVAAFLCVTAAAVGVVLALRD